MSARMIDLVQQQLRILAVNLFVRTQGLESLYHIGVIVIQSRTGLNIRNISSSSVLEDRNFPAGLRPK